MIEIISKLSPPTDDHRHETIFHNRRTGEDRALLRGISSQSDHEMVQEVFPGSCLECIGFVSHAVIKNGKKRCTRHYGAPHYYPAHSNRCDACCQDAIIEAVSKLQTELRPLTKQLNLMLPVEEQLDKIKHMAITALPRSL